VGFFQRSSSQQNQELSAIASLGLKARAADRGLRAISSAQEETPAHLCQNQMLFPLSSSWFRSFR
jgi:hypothetical protein